MLSGRAAVNRAVHGDRVAVRLLSRKEAEGSAGSSAATATPAAVEEDMANILPERKEGRREWDGAFASRRVRETGGCWLAWIDWLTRQRVRTSTSIRAWKITHM